MSAQCLGIAANLGLPSIKFRASGWLDIQSSNQSYDSVLGLVHIHFIPHPEVQSLLCRESLLLESLLLGGPEH